MDLYVEMLSAWNRGEMDKARMYALEIVSDTGLSVRQYGHVLEVINKTEKIKESLT